MINLVKDLGHMTAPKLLSYRLQNLVFVIMETSDEKTS